MEEAVNPAPATVAIRSYLVGIWKAGHKRRDNHLRSAEFIEVENHPTMRYRSTSIRQAHDGWFIDGELTLHGVTLPR